jgi:hypothetical protein
MSTPQPPHASPTPHLDVETLADLQEGLLDADRLPAAAEHLDGCAECQATRDSLDGVRTLLGDLGAEGPLAAPEDVVRRLDEALAAALPAVARASATVVPLTTLPTRGRSPWRTRVLQAAAIFVLVAAVGGIGYGGIRALNNRDSATTDSAASAGAGTAEKRAGTAGKYITTNSGRNYTQATLRAAVPALLAGSLPPVALGADSAGATPPPAAPTRSATASSSGPSAATVAPGRLLNGAALAACVANLTGGPVTPLAVDLGRFEGKPATIIVLPDPDDPSFVDAYAVEPACATGTFLTYEKVALP